MIKATINEQQTISIETGSTGVLINGLEFKADIHEQNHIYNIIRDNKVYNAEVVAADFDSKSFTIKVNHNLYEVKLSDQYDELLRQLGFDKQVKQAVNDLKAPMPGLVVEVLVAEGSTVKQGESILILEAMKMENVLKAPVDVVVKKIKIGRAHV